MLLINRLIIVIFASVASCYPLRNMLDPVVNSQDFSIKIKARDEWNASIPNRILIDSHEPISLIVVEYTDTPFCVRECAYTKNVQQLQENFMAKGYDDIKYNFLFDPHGMIYEGLGWFNLEPNTINSKNYRTIGLMQPKNTILTLEQKKAITEVFRQGMLLKILNRDYHFIGTPYLTETMRIIKYDLLEEMNAVDSQKISRPVTYDNFRATPMAELDYEEH